MNNSNILFLLRIGFVVVLAIVCIIIIGLLFLPEQKSQILIESIPSGAEVTLEGKKLDAKTPLTLKDLPRGKQLRITLSLEGYISQEKVTKLSEKYQRITFTLIPKSPSESNLPQTEEVPLIPTQNPEYLEKLKKEPFWDKLPYWSPQKTFVIEYKDSDDYLLITTFAKKDSPTFTQDTLRYRQEALSWLQTNGLTSSSKVVIKYQPTL
jgi:hypothetical protein